MLRTKKESTPETLTGRGLGPSPVTEAWRVRLCLADSCSRRSDSAGSPGSPVNYTHPRSAHIVARVGVSMALRIAPAAPPVTEHPVTRHRLPARPVVCRSRRRGSRFGTGSRVASGRRSGPWPTVTQTACRPRRAAQARSAWLARLAGRPRRRGIATRPVDNRACSRARRNP